MTTIIPLTQGYETVVDDEDADLDNWLWSAQCDPKSKTVYARRNLNKKPLLLHRVILARILGREPERNELVDHIDGNGLNNQRSNIRVATHAQNIANRRRNSNSQSGYKGVLQVRNRWRAYINVNGRQKHLGYFATAEEAHQAYCKAAKALHGEFARFE